MLKTLFCFIGIPSEWVKSLFDQLCLVVLLVRKQLTELLYKLQSLVTGEKMSVGSNAGKYSGKGWEKKAAADYYQSSFYKTGGKKK